MTPNDARGTSRDVDFRIVDEEGEETGFELVDEPRHGDIVPADDEDREIVLVE